MHLKVTYAPVPFSARFVIECKHRTEDGGDWFPIGACSGSYDADIMVAALAGSDGETYEYRAVPNAKA